MAQKAGPPLLKWAQFRAQNLAYRRRTQVMEAEVAMAKGLGFAKGQGKTSPPNQ
jgi:hypothetical protein